MIAVRVIIAAFSVGTALVATPVQGQLRRSTTPPGGGQPAPAPGTPVNRRFPFAGAWDGSRTMQNGPGAQSPAPIGMVFAVADSATRAYSGAMILPNGAHAPFQHLATTHDGLTWDQPNSGGGNWVYTAKLTSRDSLVGTLVLRDAPWKPAPEPSGTFLLVRRPAKD